MHLTLSSILVPTIHRQKIVPKEKELRHSVAFETISILLLPKMFFGLELAFKSLPETSYEVLYLIPISFITGFASQRNVMKIVYLSGLINFFTSSIFISIASLYLITLFLAYVFPYLDDAIWIQSTSNWVKHVEKKPLLQCRPHWGYIIRECGSGFFQKQKVIKNHLVQLNFIRAPVILHCFQPFKWRNKHYACAWCSIINTRIDGCFLDIYVVKLNAVVFPTCEYYLYHMPCWTSINLHN